MGKLRYDGTSEPIEISDGLLAHLKVVIGTKLRRHESFLMTWHPVAGEHQRVTLWIHPAIPLQFFFNEATTTQVEAHRVEELIQTLNASGELIIDEQDQRHPTAS